jgi:glycosyltransferase involved in cell wall biosynthesis
MNVRKLTNKLVNEVKPNLVVASSTYPFDTKIAYKIAKLAKAKFIYEVHDLWPLSPIEVGGMSRWHPFIWLTQRAENFAYSHADKVVSLLPKAAKYMQEHGMRADSFVYIPNGIKVEDDKELSNMEPANIGIQYNIHPIPQAHQKIIDSLRTTYQFLIGYAGGMAGGNSLKCAIDAMIKNNQNNPNNKTAFIMLGDGVYKTQLQEYVAQNNLHNKCRNVIFLDAVPKTQVPNFLAQMDALFVGFPKLSLYRFGVSPNKVFDYMFAKKPIVYAITAGNDLVADANCGISVEADNSAAIADAFTQLANTPKDTLVQLGINGYNYVLQNHDYRVLAKRFIQECI